MAIKDNILALQKKVEKERAEKASAQSSPVTKTTTGGVTTYSGGQGQIAPQFADVQASLNKPKAGAVANQNTGTGQRTVANIMGSQGAGGQKVQSNEIGQSEQYRYNQFSIGGEIYKYDDKGKLVSQGKDPFAYDTQGNYVGGNKVQGIEEGGRRFNLGDVDVPRQGIQQNVVTGANVGGTMTREESLAGVRDSVARSEAARESRMGYVDPASGAFIPFQKSEITGAEKLAKLKNIDFGNVRGGYYNGSGGDFSIADIGEVDYVKNKEIISKGRPQMAQGEDPLQYQLRVAKWESAQLTKAYNDTYANVERAALRDMAKSEADKLRKDLKPSFNTEDEYKGYFEQDKNLNSLVESAKADAIAGAMNEMEANIKNRSRGLDNTSTKETMEAIIKSIEKDEEAKLDIRLANINREFTDKKKKAVDELAKKAFIQGSKITQEQSLSVDERAKLEEEAIQKALLDSGLVASPARAKEITKEIIKLDPEDRDKVTSLVEDGTVSTFEGAIAMVKRDNTLAGGGTLDLPEAKKVFTQLNNEGNVNETNAFSEAYRLTGDIAKSEELLKGIGISDTAISQKAYDYQKNVLGYDDSVIELKGVEALRKRALDPLRTDPMGADITKVVSEIQKYDKSGIGLRAFLNEGLANDKIQGVPRAIMEFYKEDMEYDALTKRKRDLPKFKSLETIGGVQYMVDEFGGLTRADSVVAGGSFGEADTQAARTARSLISQYNSGELDAQQVQIEADRVDPSGLTGIQTLELIDKQGGKRVVSMTPDKKASILEQTRRLNTLLNNNDYEVISGKMVGSPVSVWFTSRRDDVKGTAKAFLASDTLMELIDAKSKGATFGALSDSELNMLRSAASDLASFAKYDKNGEFMYFKASEPKIKETIERIQENLYKSLQRTEDEPSVVDPEITRQTDQFKQIVTPEFIDMFNQMSPEQAAEFEVENPAILDYLEQREIRSNSTLDTLKREEGFREQAYIDPAGVPTIGYGFTKVGGVPVKVGDVMTQEEADRELERQAQQYSTWANKVEVDLTPEQRDALTSFEYNLGSGIWNNHPDLLAYLNTGEFDKFADLLEKFNNIRDPETGELTPLRGLSNRRQREASAFRNYNA